MLAICEVSKECGEVAKLDGVVGWLLSVSLLPFMSLLWRCPVVYLSEFTLVDLGCCFYFLTKTLHLNRYR